MRLVIKRGAGLIGLYQRNPRHQTTNLKTKQKLRHPMYVRENADDLNKKYVGKGSDVSSNCMRNDAVDSNNNESTELKSDQESVMETISNSSKESTVDRNEEMIVDDEELKDKSDEVTQAADVKCKYSPSYIDFLLTIILMIRSYLHLQNNSVLILLCQILMKRMMTQLKRMMTQ